MSTLDSSGSLASELDDLLADDDRRLVAAYPGDRGVRQPVSTVYVPADRVSSELVSQWSVAALEVVDREAPTAAGIADAWGLSPDVARAVHGRVRAKLTDQPIEDLRIDFEDGYGARSDDVEDADVIGAARSLAAQVVAGSATPFHGIRFKSFEQPTRARGVRTLTLFVSELAAAGGVTDRLRLTLPKVTSVRQVEAMRIACERLESSLGLATGQLTFEIQVETPQSILDSDGRVLVAPMIQAGGGRVTGLHYGTYDYSASCGIAAAYQSMEHPAADQAKALMQVAAAGTGVLCSDGSTNVLPVGSSVSILAAWRLHGRLVRRSLERGFYQGWDLHPAQLPSRYVATYAFFRDGLAESAARLRAYVGGGDSSYLDEPATATALAGFVLRGLDCGATDADEVDDLIGISPARLAALAKRPPA